MTDDRDVEFLFYAFHIWFSSCVYVFNYDDDYEKEDNGAADDSDEWKFWNILYFILYLFYIL